MSDLRVPAAAFSDERFSAASALLAAHRDVIGERVGTDVPVFCARRGWEGFLRALPDDAVSACERDGLAAHVAALPGAPPDLVALAERVRAVTALPALPAPPSRARDRLRMSPRKQEQVAVLTALVRELDVAPVRVIDVGCGHGHLTRHLADALEVPAIGWERDEARVTVASQLARASRHASFEVLDVRDGAVSVGPRDLVVGLHACGALGDDTVRLAGATGAPVCLVGCCLQKREGARAPLVAPPGFPPTALTLPRDVLGLANVRDGDDGVEEDLQTRVASRLRRHVLRELLERRGLSLAPGEEMRGVNRRRATGDLHALVRMVFERRGLALPTGVDVEVARTAGERAHALVRRWELPRFLLGRLLEVWVALDRAALLASMGREPSLFAAWDARTSPRNVVLVASRVTRR